jgi:membrane-associated PAP2 superfamily phosphatase
MTPARLRHLAFITLGLLLALLAWDASDLDMQLARLFGGTHGFPLSQHWMLTRGLHDGARLLSWLLVTWLALSVWWPLGAMRRLQPRERVQLVATTLLAGLAVAVLKSFSTTSCPWDLAAFGGEARHVSHWLRVADGGSGHCFPAGHASSGFSFVGGYFVWRRVSVVRARTWLSLALLAGFVLGGAQQMRGAHFMSHTLWTAWICWTLAFAVDAALHRWSAGAISAMPPGPPKQPLLPPVDDPVRASPWPRRRG